MADDLVMQRKATPPKQATVGTFRFLTEATEPQVNLGLIDDLSIGKSLTAEDVAVLAEIRSSLRRTGRLPFPWTQQEAHHLALEPRETWLDYLIFRSKFVNYPKNKIVSGFPLYLLIEPMSVCNLRCVMCYQVDPTFTRKPYMGMMDIGLFRSVVDQAAEGGTKAITLASRGEPTLHPRLGEMLEYVSGKFTEVKLTTNASRLSEELCHTILSTGVNVLVFSVDASTAEIYQQIRVRGKFDQVVANIRRFHRIRSEQYPSAHTSTRISAVRIREDQDPVAFKAFWSEVVDEVGMKDAQVRWDTYSNPVSPDLNSACVYPWERLYVWWDGTANPCDSDYKSLLSPGNVKTQSLREIWNGPALTKLRLDHVEGRRQEHTPCDRCGACFE